MKNFGDKIKQILNKNGYHYRVRVFPKQDKILKNGKRFIQEYEKVVIYAGRNVEKYVSRRSKKLIAWKNTKGEWEGDLEIAKQQGYQGTDIYLLDYHDKTEPLKYVMYSDCDWNDDKEYTKNKMLKIMENWKFQETERAKLDKEAVNEKRRNKLNVERNFKNSNRH